MIIVDMHQVLISNIMAQLTMKSWKGTKVGVVNKEMVRHMCCNSLRGYVRKFGNEYGRDNLVLACDSADPWRRDYFPNYKWSRRQGREESKSDWDLMFKIILEVKDEIADNLPYKVVAVDNAEADDIIAVIVGLQEEKKYLIISGDKDFKQLQKFKNVFQFSPIQKIMVKEDNPRRYLHEQIIKGDRSDGVPNILSADDVFATKKKLEEWAQVDDIPLGSETKKYYNRNKKLIDFTMIPKSLEKSIINSYKNCKVPSRSKLLPYFMNYKLKSLIENINDF